ncbi:hypothetical protein R1CP_15770 [Rhodococcus opacus]|uniref:Uncharacterized protein n=1 Tax=Rhodococcus opacus TaxID=37919 RepID=A0A1B1K5G4_RHOOP|nr:hypothetical protein R1CP_15770 [Rhodococcus opacus]
MCSGPCPLVVDPDRRRPGVAARPRTGQWQRSVTGPGESLVGSAADRRAGTGCGPRGGFRSRARTFAPSLNASATGHVVSAGPIARVICPRHCRCPLSCIRPGSPCQPNRRHRRGQGIPTSGEPWIQCERLSCCQRGDVGDGESVVVLEIATRRHTEPPRHTHRRSTATDQRDRPRETVDHGSTYRSFPGGCIQASNTGAACLQPVRCASFRCDALWFHRAWHPRPSRSTHCVPVV